MKMYLIALGILLAGQLATANQVNTGVGTEINSEGQFIFCKNEGSTTVYIYDSRRPLTLMSMESRARLQFSNAYWTYASYALGKQATREDIQKFLQALPEEEKIKCGGR